MKLKTRRKLKYLFRVYYITNNLGSIFRELPEVNKIFIVGIATVVALSYVVLCLPRFV